MNDDAQAEIEISEETKHEQMQDKPRGTCTGAGCGFEYQLGTARSGEFKGELVIRKHNSRVGPGLCEGASRPPKDDEPPAELPHDAGSAPFADPEPAESEPGPAFSAAYESEGSCGHSIQEGDTIRADGEGGYLCADCAEHGAQPDRPQHIHDDGNGGVWVHDGIKASCALPECAPATVPHVGYEPSGAPVPGVDPITFTDPVPGPEPVVSTALPFTDPAPGPAALPPISGQPEPDRDRWGRYLILGVSNTRATTFAKLGSSTYALGEWNERMLIKGLTERPDLLALAHGLDVKRDKQTLNQIADDAQTHAGNKVAANLGTAYHAFSERLEAGLCTMDDVPVQYRARCAQYLDTVRAHGLVTRPEWIERTTGVRADQVGAPAPVAGTLDRIYQLPNGELIIGDLKTGSDLSYSEAEISVQLAIYAHGCNTHGLFDWNTKTWQALDRPVRTDFAVVMHMPANGEGCVLYRADLVKGWAYAQVSGAVQARQKAKGVLSVLVPGSLGPVAPAAPEASLAEMTRAMQVVATTYDQGTLADLYDHAVAAGKFSPVQLDQIKGACRMQWDALNIPY